MKGVGKLVSWGTLPTIDNIKRNLDNPDFLTISWRKVDFKDPWILNILLPNNANDCVNLILRHLKKQGLIIDKKYEKKKKLLESEVTAEGVIQQQHQVEKLIKTIKQYEQVCFNSGGEPSNSQAEGQILADSSNQQISPSTVQHLITLYN